MADPFSVTGSAVGVVSLGIQVCKGLIWYIDGITTAKDKAARISKQMEDLADLLELLESVVGNGQPGVTSKTVTAGIEACRDALREIKSRLAVHGSASGSRIKQQLRSLKQQLCYPFKQAEILYWKGTIENIQQNLQTALLVLQTDQQRIDFHNLRSQIEQQTLLGQFNLQTVTTRTDAHYKELSLRLSEQTQIIREKFLHDEEHTALVQGEVRALGTWLPPIAADVSQMNHAIPELLISIKELEAKLDRLTPEAISPAAVQEDMSNWTNLARQVRHTKPISKMKHQRELLCQCRGQPNTTVFARRPLFFSRTRTAVHDSHCPHSIYEDAMTDIQLRFSMCSLALKRKAQVALAISHRAGFSTITPALNIHRIVTEDSPAFKLLRKFNQQLKMNLTTDAWEKPARQLLTLFQKRLASPWDKLPDGQSLLHYLCNRMSRWDLPHGEKGISNYYSLGMRLLQYMPEVAKEKEDYGRTCIDILFHGGRHDVLVQEFLDHGITISLSKHLFHPIRELKKSWHYENGEDMLECSDGMKAIFFRSENGLKDFVSSHRNMLYSEKESFSLYEFATVSGWLRGCEILLEHGVNIHRVHPHMHLLDQAIVSREIDVFRFWLKTRESQEGATLDCIGSLEDAFQIAARLDRVHSDFPRVALLALIKQRRQLGAMAEVHLSKNLSSLATNRLLDARAWKIIDELVSRGISVKESLRPSTRSIFYRSDGGSLGLEALQMLWKAGFRDMTWSDFNQKGDTISLSPLMLIATGSTNPLYPRYAGAIQWFLSNGTDLGEKWLESETTLRHCLGWMLGTEIYPHPATLYSDEVRMLSELSRAQVTDHCICGCSRNGCLVVHTFLKRITSGHLSREDYSLSYKTFIVKTLTASVRNNLNLRDHDDIFDWLVMEFIRISTFWELGLRHTCCDLRLIQHSGNPQLDKSPRRYSSEEHDMIRDEDQILLDRLEELMEYFSNAWLHIEKQTSKVDHFFDMIWKPKMEEVSLELRDEDKDFVAARQELGIFLLEESEWANSSYETEDAEDGTEDEV